MALDIVSEKMGLNNRDETWVKIVKPIFKTLRSTGGLQKQFLDSKIIKKVTKKQKQDLIVSCDAKLDEMFIENS
jgi:hypothetical protein